MVHTAYQVLLIGYNPGVGNENQIKLELKTGVQF